MRAVARIGPDDCSPALKRLHQLRRKLARDKNTQLHSIHGKVDKRGICYSSAVTSVSKRLLASFLLATPYDG